jgi:AraC family transcriptional regulator of adaptative response/methylated-DNA-[protein]-cysteine methyltransferase
MSDFSDTSQDYARVTAALDYLSENWSDQPDLAAAADVAHLSPHHFQRVFTRWTGASPKRMVQALTHASARSLLVDGASVLDAALETGLSSPSRLHDVFIAEEAVTPGEAKSGGDGLVFKAGVAPTPFGAGVFLIAPRGLSALAFADPGEEADALADLTARFPQARIETDDALAREWAGRVFDAKPGEDPLPVALYGTPWRRQVWRALAAHPAGPHGQLSRYRGGGLHRQGEPGGRRGGRRQPDQLADPLSPGAGPRWPPDRLSLGCSA